MSPDGPRVRRVFPVSSKNLDCLLLAVECDDLPLAVDEKPRDFLLLRPVVLGKDALVRELAVEPKDPAPLPVGDEEAAAGGIDGRQDLVHRLRRGSGFGGRRLERPDVTGPDPHRRLRRR